MMPPHVTDVRVDGLVVLLRGWTFAMLEPEVEVRDAEARVVPVAVTFEGAWEGTGTEPGSQQFRSVARLQLPKPGAYTVRMFDETWPIEAP